MKIKLEYTMYDRASCLVELSNPTKISIRAVLQISDYKSIGFSPVVGNLHEVDSLESLRKTAYENAKEELKKLSEDIQEFLQQNP